MYRTDLLDRIASALDPAPRPVPAPGDRLAGVLVPIVGSGTVVFTKRGAELSRHPGEISFPGGIRHERDATLAETALRETQEELGIAPDQVVVLGALPAVHTHVSGILVVPFVGRLDRPPTYRPNEGEIDEVLEYPLDELDAAETEVEWRLDGGVYRGYAYEMGAHTIWGATARILHGLLELLRSAA